jgi:hypothetical protein
MSAATRISVAPQVRSRTRETRFRGPDAAVEPVKREGWYLAKAPLDPRARRMFVFADGSFIEIKGGQIAAESPRLEWMRDEIFRD